MLQDPSTDNKILLPREFERWSSRRGSNPRPLPYQGSALPLSHASQKQLSNYRNNGAGEEARTLDFQLGRLALYQLSYTRKQKKWWREVDSNHRRLTPADLQSAPFSHSGITPQWSCSQESNLRPTDYKSVALPTELEQHISNSFI